MNFSSSNEGTLGIPTKSRVLIKKRAAPKIFDKRPNPLSASKSTFDAPKASNESGRADEEDKTENTTRPLGESCGVKDHPELESFDSQPTIGCPIEENVSKSCLLSQSNNLIESASFERVFDQSLGEVLINNESNSSANAPDDNASNLPCNNVAFVPESPLKCTEPSSSTSASGVLDEIVLASEKAVQNDYDQQNVIILQIDGKECERVFSEAVEHTCEDEITGGTVLLELVDESGVPSEDINHNDSRGISVCEVTVDEHALAGSGNKNEENQLINTSTSQEIVDEKDVNSRDERTKIKTNALPPKKRVIRDIVDRTCKRRPEDSLLLKENEKMEKAFKHCALRKKRKKKKVKVEKTVNIRKKNKPKMLVNEENKDNLSLRDYIFYVPDSEPMKEEIIKPEVALGMPEEQEKEDNIDEPEEMDHGPKLIIKDGEIIVDPQSTMIKRSVPQVYKDIKVERFKQRREAFETWSLKDTVRFYYTLWQYGIDFSLISSSFSSKSRHAVKNKFNLERRNNSCIVSKILAKKSDDDEESFKSIMKELIIRCSKLAKKKKVKVTVPSVTTSHHFDKKSKKKNKTKRKPNPTDDSLDDKNNLFRKLFNCDSKNDDDDDTLIGSDFDESDVNNLVNITFSTNVVYQDMNIVESVSFDPTASNPVDVNVTISHDDKRVSPTEGNLDVIHC